MAKGAVRILGASIVDSRKSNLLSVGFRFPVFACLRVSIFSVKSRPSVHNNVIIASVNELNTSQLL